IGMTTVASLLATSAFAADLPMRSYYTKAPVFAEPLFNWTGFYIGGNLGYSLGSSSNTETISNSLTGASVAGAARDNVNGFIGGGQFGYNWQMSRWVAGLEGDIQGSRERGFATLVCTGCGDGPSNITSTLTQHLAWFGTVRGRAGFLVTPAVLLYGTGGLAYGELDTAGSISGPTLQGAGSAVFPNLNSTRVGWTAGAGIEGAIGGNWTAKLEYLYMDLGTASFGPLATNILVPIRTNAGASYSSHFTDNILRVGVNYKFDSPVVARY
ncbi:MAG TPA: outer membrane beta-barrel protein, partial [Bradyrhizobium sp.]|nr:outer membrane beta-barrel protein [Bradyrhizobium sp.]